MRPLRKQVASVARSMLGRLEKKYRRSKLYADIVALEAALREHVYLENNVLFARAAGGEY